MNHKVRKRKKKEHQRKITKCIYCGNSSDLTEEHAWPQSLRSKNTHHHKLKLLCKDCNSNFGSDIDYVFSRGTKIAYIQNCVEKRDPRFYYQKTVGGKSFYELTCFEEYKGLILRVQRDKNNNITPLKPQISITYSNSKQNCEEIIRSNFNNFLKHNDTFAKTLWFSSNNYIKLYNNTLLLLSGLSQKYFNRPELLYKEIRVFLKSLKHICINGFFDADIDEVADWNQCVLNHVPDDVNISTMLHDFSLKKENIKLNYQPIVIGFEDLKIELYRAIAKIAFHCFLNSHRYIDPYHWRFDRIKEFIKGKNIEHILESPYRNQNIYEWPETNQSGVIVDKNQKDSHVLRFSQNSSEITCQLILFPNLSIEPTIFDIYIAGDGFTKRGKREKRSWKTITIPFNLENSHFLRR